MLFGQVKRAFKGASRALEGESGLILDFMDLLPMLFFRREIFYVFSVFGLMSGGGTGFRCFGS